jgi:hypothetical protein
MNLAIRDIRHNFGRFVLTTVGLGLLLMLVMGMGGIYPGLFTIDLKKGRRMTPRVGRIPT